MKFGTVLLIFILEHIEIKMSNINRKCEYRNESDNQQTFNYIRYKNRNGMSEIDALMGQYMWHKPIFEDITHYFYARDHHHHGYRYKIHKCKAKIEIEQYFDRSKPIFFIIHGFRDSYDKEYSQAMKNAILHKREVNVFVVDYSPVVNLPYLAYRYARMSVITTGKYIACFINSLIKSYDLSPKQFRIIGHSLGAHVAGVAGAFIPGKIEYNIGLDPAGPLFTAKQPDCLNRKHADLVHVIHTNGLNWCLSPDLIICDGYGLHTAVGHVDYYPNGGRLQPGCSLFDFSCNHARSWQYYNESIVNESFDSEMCESYEIFQFGKCQLNPTSILPSIPFRQNIPEGCYFLLTEADSPYSMGRTGIDPM